MHRRNRVTPFGEFIAVPDRGALMGNRGILTGADGVQGDRLWTGRAWICCRLDYPRGDGKLPVAGPGVNTQLFFLDEATALAAGHRPCARCRRPAFRDFLDCWARGNGWPRPVRVADVDRRLHAERVEPWTRRKVTHTAPLAGLPDGAMVALPGRPDEARLVWGGATHRWAVGGYDEDAEPAGGEALVTVLTPRSTVAALAAGYRPHVALAPI